MDRLPNELTDAIFEKISKRDDLCHVRQTCGQWADVGAPHLFPRVWLSSHPLDVQVFRIITRNPLLCSGVKELIWDDTTYCDSLMDKEKYLQTAEQTASWGAWSTDWCTDTYPTYGYRLFLQKARLHHHIRRRRIDERLLVDALPKLKNLKSVVLSSRHHYMPWPDDVDSIVNSPTARQWAEERRFQTYAYPPTVNWKTFHERGNSSDPTAKELRQMMSVDFHEDMWTEDEITNASCVHVLRPFRGLLILLRALSNAKINVENFEIRPQYASKWGQDNSMVGISHFFFREQTADLDRFIAIVRCLRRLQLVVSCENLAPPDSQASAIATMKRGHLTRVLQAAQGLEELRLELPVPNVMRVIGTGTHFPQLKTLTLTQGIVEPLELIDLLRRHHKTLQSLSLSHCNSSTKSWTTFFEHLKSERLNLLTIEVEFLFDPDGVNWCRTMEQDDINAFFTGNGPVPLLWTPWRGSTPPPRF